MYCVIREAKTYWCTLGGAVLLVLLVQLGLSLLETFLDSCYLFSLINVCFHQAKNGSEMVCGAKRWCFEVLTWPPFPLQEKSRQMLKKKVKRNLKIMIKRSLYKPITFQRSWQLLFLKVKASILVTVVILEVRADKTQTHFLWHYTHMILNPCTHS